jgi:hypothetical protein
MKQSNDLRDGGSSQRRVSAADAAIGRKLRTLRLERGMSQSAVGRLAG